MFIYLWGRIRMTKTLINNAKIERAAYLLKALAHPLRIKIIGILEEQKEAGVNEMVDLLEAEQSLVSHHLSKMYDKGLLSMRREGKNSYYSLSDQNITTILKCINNCKTA